jgi:uncharacterized metal-binding protein
MIGLFTCFGGAAYSIALAKACIRLWHEYPDDIKIVCVASVGAGVEKIIDAYKPTYGKYDKLLILEGCESNCVSKIINKSVLKPQKSIVITELLGKKKKAGLPTADEDEEVYNAIKKELVEFLPKLEPPCVCCT